MKILWLSKWDFGVWVRNIPLCSQNTRNLRYLWRSLYYRIVPQPMCSSNTSPTHLGTRSGRCQAQTWNKKIVVPVLPLRILGLDLKEHFQRRIYIHIINMIIYICQKIPRILEADQAMVWFKKRLVNHMFWKARLGLFRLFETPKHFIFGKNLIMSKRRL